MSPFRIREMLPRCKDLANGRGLHLTTVRPIGHHGWISSQLCSIFDFYGQSPNPRFTFAFITLGAPQRSRWKQRGGAFLTQTCGASPISPMATRTRAGL